MLLQAKLVSSSGNNYLHSKLELFDVNEISWRPGFDELLEFEANHSFQENKRVRRQAADVNSGVTSGWPASESFINSPATTESYSSDGGASMPANTRTILRDLSADDGDEQPLGARCVIGEETLGFWNLLDVLVYSALPALILLILDTLIVRRLRKALRAKTRTRSDSGSTCIMRENLRRGTGAAQSLGSCNSVKYGQQLQQPLDRRITSDGLRDQRHPPAAEQLGIKYERSRVGSPHAECVEPLDGRQSFRNYRGALFDGRQTAASELPASLTCSSTSSRAPTCVSGPTALTDLHLTVVLLVPNIAFLILTFPISAGHAMQMIIGEQKLFRVLAPGTLMLLFAIAELLAFARHALNFYLCVMTSKGFRRATRRFITRSRPYRLLLVSAYRVRSLFLRRRCCCFRYRRSRNAPAVIRFQWIAAGHRVPPNFHGAGAHIQLDSLAAPYNVQCSSHLLRSGAPRTRNYLNNLKYQQPLSSLSSASSWVRPHPSRNAAVGAAVRVNARCALASKTHADNHLVCICVCRHSSSCTVSSNARRPLHSDTFNVRVRSASGTSEFPMRNEMCNSCNLEVTV